MWHRQQEVGQAKEWLPSSWGAEMVPDQLLGHCPISVQQTGVLGTRPPHPGELPLPVYLSFWPELLCAPLVLPLPHCSSFLAGHG